MFPPQRAALMKVMAAHKPMCRWSSRRVSTAHHLAHPTFITSNRLSVHGRQRTPADSMRCGSTSGIQALLESSLQVRDAALSSTQRHHHTRTCACAQQKLIDPGCAVLLQADQAAAQNIVTRLHKLTPTPDQQQAEANLQLLRSIYTKDAVIKLLSHQPQLLTGATRDWVEFLQGYGVGKQDLFRALMYSSKSLLQGSTYNAGQVILFLKQSMGFSDQEIIDRVMLCYPELLTLSMEQDIEPVVKALKEIDFVDADIQKLLFEYPMVLYRQEIAEVLPLFQRIHAGRKGRYTNSGSYDV